MAVTLISMRIIGSPSASTPSSVQIGARSGMYWRNKSVEEATVFVGFD
jgi:hypothetical protein